MAQLVYRWFEPQRHILLDDREVRIGKNVGRGLEERGYRFSQYGLSTTAKPDVVIFFLL